ncbi:MAG: hypothetical protein JXK16_12560 [Thiotrichales bacterium]|nr:hypothetical protein [Thiotrichales bacterium]
MQYTKQIKITILVVFLLFLSAVNAFAFMGAGGSAGPGVAALPLLNLGAASVWLLPCNRTFVCVELKC